MLLDYVFASDEYNESVRGSGGMADPVAIFVNGDNCATVPGPSGPAPVTINTVNSGNPYGACLVLSLSFWLFFHLRAGGEMETETA